MTVSYSWLNSFFKRPLPQPEKLAEILTMHSFEVESVEKMKNDWILNIDVLPDRAGDSLSHIGIARECSAILDLKMIYPESKIKEGSEKIKNLLSVEIKDKNCKRYSARVISNVKIGPSPKWAQDKLANCGIYPINNVVDATNYVMLELGQPLHVFDYDKIEGHKIIVRHAKPGEKILLLNNNQSVLDKKIMVIADEKRALAIAGVKGGKHAEVICDTNTIVLESASFDPKTIGQTARRLNIRTDASARFEHHLDPNITEAALNRLTSLIVEWAKGEVASGMIDIYPEKVKPVRIKLDIKLLNQILGINIPLNDVINILTRLGIKVINKNLLLEIPTFRQDLTIPENIIEEIGRIYGYDKVPSRLPVSFLAPAKRNDDLYFINKIKDMFKELKYCEVYNYSFISDKELKEFKLKAEAINNPVSSFFKYLRPSLIPQIVNNVKENLKSYNEVKVFEIGKAFVPEEKKIEENIIIAGATSLMDIAELKGELVCVLDNLGIKASFKDWDIKTQGEKIGEIKQIEDVLCFELYFNILFKYIVEDKEYEKISYHPEAIRDISGIVADSVDIEEIKQSIKAKDLVKSVEVFDVYKGQSIGKGRMSISMHIIIQSEERTLDSETIDKLLKEIIKSLFDKFNWEERK